MKISKLIVELQKTQEKYGDIIVAQSRYVGGPDLTEEITKLLVMDGTDPDFKIEGWMEGLYTRHDDEYPEEMYVLFSTQEK